MRIWQAGNGQKARWGVTLGGEWIHHTSSISHTLIAASLTLWLQAGYWLVGGVTFPGKVTNWWIGCGHGHPFSLSGQPLTTSTLVSHHPQSLGFVQDLPHSQRNPYWCRFTIVPGISSSEVWDANNFLWENACLHREKLQSSQVNIQSPWNWIEIPTDGWDRGNNGWVGGLRRQSELHDLSAYVGYFYD